MNTAVLFFLLVACVIGFCFVAIAALCVGIYFLNRRVLIPTLVGGTTRAEPIIEDWAEDRGYEVLAIEAESGRNHPFADRFGMGIGKWPGKVYWIEVRTPTGRTRVGWVYLRVGLYGRVDPASLEVEWDE